MALGTPAEPPSGCVLVVDSAPIIYFLEGHPTLADRYQPLFDRAAAGDLNLVVSTITLAEIVSGPSAAGNEYLAEQYRLAITGGPGLSVVPVTETLAVTAARFRARYRLRLPDAIQLAAAVEVRAYALVTHDRGFRRVKEVRLLGQALSRK